MPQQQQQQQLQFYFCYDPHLAQVLKAENQKLITVALATKTKKTFWLYQRTAELTEILDNYFSK